MDQQKLVTRVNDIFRHTLTKRLGRLEVSPMVRAQSRRKRRQIIQLVRTHDRYSCCKIHDWHDHGLIKVDGECYVFWIEYRYRHNDQVADNPCDTLNCYRVLKVIHSTER